MLNFGNNFAKCYRFLKFLHCWNVDEISIEQYIKFHQTLYMLLHYFVKCTRLENDVNCTEINFMRVLTLSYLLRRNASC